MGKEKGTNSRDPLSRPKSHRNPRTYLAGASKPDDLFLPECLQLMWYEIAVSFLSQPVKEEMWQQDLFNLAQERRNPRTYLAGASKPDDLFLPECLQLMWYEIAVSFLSQPVKEEMWQQDLFNLAQERRISCLGVLAVSFSYFYIVSAWGGYMFIINLLPLHALVLLVTWGQLIKGGDNKDE